MALLPPQTPAAPTAPARKLWHAGTLTYTTGGLVALFCWLLWGDFAWSMKERSIFPVVQLLLRQFEASDLLAGLLLGAVPQAMALLIGPIISYRSDRHRGRWGRRIPFLLIPTPIAVVSMVGLAFSPALGHSLHHALGGHSPGANHITLLFFGTFWVLFEFATITANAILYALINDVVPHAVIGRFYGLFRALSLIAGMVFNYWLFGKAETHFVAIFIGIALLYGFGFTAMCLKVKEGSYPPPPLPGPEERHGFFVATKTYFQECFSRPYYLWFFVSQALTWMAMTGVNLFNVYFAKSLGMSMDTFGKCLALTYLISLGLSYFLGAVADRFHPLRVGLMVLGVCAVGLLWGGLFATTPARFAIALVGFGVLSGTWMTITASLPQRLLPTARFAQFNSALGILVSLGTMVTGPVLGAFLDRTGHDYRHTYFAGFGLLVLALLAGLIVYRKFKLLGGPQNYVAP